MCKLMESDKLNINILESFKKITPFQSDFWKGRQTIEPVVCLEDEVRKAQVNNQIVGGVRHAYDMLWLEGLLIKLKLMGTAGNVFDWVGDFFSDGSIQVRTGAELSRQYIVENDTPQGSVVSPTLFFNYDK